MLSTTDKFLTQGKGRDVPLSHDVACVEPDATFVSLIKGFSVSQFHRLWVMDGDVLRGIITLSDVIKTLLAFVAEGQGGKKHAKAKPKAKKSTK